MSLLEYGGVSTKRPQAGSRSQKETPLNSATCTGILAILRQYSETGRIWFRRVRFQTPSSLSFLAPTEFRGESSLSSSQPSICVPKRTHRVFCRTHRVVPQNSVSSLFWNSALETVLRSFPKCTASSCGVSRWPRTLMRHWAATPWSTYLRHSPICVKQSEKQEKVVEGVEGRRELEGMSQRGWEGISKEVSSVLRRF